MLCLIGPKFSKHLVSVLGTRMSMSFSKQGFESNLNLPVFQITRDLPLGNFYLHVMGEGMQGRNNGIRLCRGKKYIKARLESFRGEH